LIYLVLQIVFASAFTLIIKWVHVRREEDAISVGTINYIVAALAAFPVFWRIETGPATAGAVWTGASMGQVYFIAFFFVIYCVKHIGASITTVVSVLSLLFPITFAALIWKELPGLVQSLGIVLAVVALLLISVRRSSGTLSEHRLSYGFASLALLAFFGLCGCSRLAQETFKHVSDPNQRPAFLFAAFGVTAVYSLGAMLYRRRAIKPTEIGLGILLGLSNVLQTQFILKSLELFPGYIVFTATSAGAIVLTTFVATLLFKEEIETHAYFGIGLAVVSLFALNLE
jgi:drug/metabolite transporter (DMT)-like permease